jgi:hypothetical protein
MGSGEDAQFVFAKYDYTAQGNQVSSLFLKFQYNSTTKGTVRCRTGIGFFLFHFRPV